MILAASVALVTTGTMSVEWYDMMNVTDSSVA